jgi:hypothetical protein
MILRMLKVYLITNIHFSHVLKPTFTLLKKTLLRHRAVAREAAAQGARFKGAQKKLFKLKNFQLRQDNKYLVNSILKWHF